MSTFNESQDHDRDDEYEERWLGAGATLNSIGNARKDIIGATIGANHYAVMPGNTVALRHRPKLDLSRSQPILLGYAIFFDNPSATCRNALTIDISVVMAGLKGTNPWWVICDTEI